jgi:tetratricopeptide (TPR) repeat protein
MLVIGAIAVALALVSCEKVPEEDLFAKAETLYLDQKYDEAIEQFKRFLLEHPEHSGAHFYLGTCYFASDDNRWLGLAQGELETAIALFERQGKVNSIPRFDATYFELISHINLSKIYLGLVFTIVEDTPQLRGFDKRIAVQLALDKCDEQYEIVKKIAPDNPDVAWLRDRIDTLREALSIPRQTAPRTQHPSAAV